MATCGYRTGLIEDRTRPNWQNDGPRPIAWSAWYPTDAGTPVQRPSGQFFDPGDVALNAPLVPESILPVVLLSHGTGGTSESLGWLARGLACAGYVVLGANHHGNTGLAPYEAEGFLCWWERATDLSVLLSRSQACGFPANRLDPERVSAVGFSLGGHTVLAMLGARTVMEEFEAWRRANAIRDGGPREFPDAEAQIPALAKSSAAFRQSWARHSDDFTDQRVKSVVALAPAPPVRGFTAPSVAAINKPVTILTGSADMEAPTEHCADWLTAQNARFRHEDLGRHVGHYTFLESPSDKSLRGKIDIFSDHETIERKEIHKDATKLVLEALA